MEKPQGTLRIYANQNTCPLRPWWVSLFQVYLLWVKAHLALYSVLNVKALVGAFNQEEALLGAFCVIVKLQSSRRFVSSSSSQSGVVMEKWATLNH